MDMFQVPNRQFIAHCIQKLQQEEGNNTGYEKQNAEYEYTSPNSTCKTDTATTIYDKSPSYIYKEEIISTIGSMKFSQDNATVQTDPAQADATYHDDEQHISILDYMDSSLDSSINTWENDDDLYMDENTDISSTTESNTESLSLDTEEDSITSFQSKSPTETFPSTIPIYLNEEVKTFLQLKGISIATYNMACNFNVALALHIMAKHEISILAIQEHTPWNRTLTDMEIAAIERTCHNYGFLVNITKVQILIIDKQIATCLRETETHLEGRLIATRFEITRGKYVNFISLYGFPHSPNNRSKHNIDEQDENEIIQEMRKLRNTLRIIINRRNNASEIVYAFGDMQDTPDNSTLFRYGSNKIIKHPLGIIQTCEELGMQCTVYQHLEMLPRPIISRHGSKGGRFLDSMYCNQLGLIHVMGTSIIQDTGVFSDHDMVITKCDFGYNKTSLCQDKEERISFRDIMNIPIMLQPNQTHPTINDNVYKGTEYQTHAKLFSLLQEAVNDHTNDLKIME